MRDFRNRKAWSEYRAEKLKGFPYSGTAALKLNEGYRGGKDMKDHQTSAASEFFPYWAALELIKEGKASCLRASVEEILKMCKKNRASDLAYYEKFKPSYDMYKGYPLVWECFRPYDERFNAPGYGTETEICTLPFRATKEDKKALEELIYTPFVDPICDGRDCTGARYTSYIKIFTTVEKTVIIHGINYDV